MGKFKCDVQVIRDKAIVPLDKSCKNIEEAANDLASINIPNNFQYRGELVNIADKIKKRAGSVGEIKNLILSATTMIEEVEAKNENILNRLFNIDFMQRTSEDNNVNDKVIKNESRGTFIEADEMYICGYYSSLNGRKFTIFDQQYKSEFGFLFGEDKVDWSQKCNKAASIIVASAFTDKSSEELVNEVNRHRMDNIIPTNDFWNEFGLERSDYYQWMPTYQTAYGDDIREGYTEVLREHLENGGVAALIWVGVEGDKSGVYKGKSGEEWTQAGVGMHWVAIIDYSSEEEKMVISDARGADWYDIDEFNHNIGNMVLISEKEKSE